MTNAPTARRVSAVSVVIPAWNAATTIAETLASLQSQRFTEWDAVVVDDGSTDDTSAMVAAIAESDPRISLVRQESAGAAAARNRGLELIKHRWVLFLDADDWILPEHLERLSALLDSSPEADAAVCGWTLVRAGRAIESEYCRGEGDLFPILARRPAFAIHTCLIDRVRVDAAGGFDLRWIVQQDWQLWQRVARAGARFAVIRDPLAVYRLHEGTITGDQSRLAAEALQVIAVGHAPDPDVPNPHPDHASGRPIHELTDAQVTHLAWPAGIEIARGADARRLFDQVADGVALGAAEHIGMIIGRAAASHTDPATLTSPARWPSLDRLLGALLERLASITGDQNLPRTARLAFERHMLEATGETRQLSLIATAHVEVGAEIGDLPATGYAERLRIAVTMEGDSLGTVELPVIEGRVRAAVVSDAIANAFAWPILGRLFRSTIYASWTMRRDADGWSAWSGDRLMCSGLPDDPAERATALHDRAGWALFLEESWHSSVRLEWWRRLVPWRFEPAGRASPAVVPIEVSAPIPHVPSGTRAAFLAGGALVVLVDAFALDGSRSSIQKVLADAAGFELCRVVVREALIGSALSLTPLRDRLAKAAARRLAVRHRPLVAIQAGTQAPPLAPGAHQALGLAAYAGVGAVLARHDSPDAGFAAARFADLPASCEASARRLAVATGNAFFAISGTSRGAIAYDPGVSTVSAAAPPRASATSLATPVGAAAFGRHHFERLFASGADPWRYEAPYERRKYDQTLSLIGNGRFRRSLEAGCAEGHFTVRLAALSDEVIAADVSEIALARVEARCASAGIGNVVTRRLDLSSDILPGDCDLVVCSEVLYYMGDRSALAKVAGRLAAALAPGGVLVMAHAHVLNDSPADAGFDWGLPYGAKTIGETFQAVPGIALEHEIRTPLYRIQRFRRLADGSSKADEPIIETVPNSVLPEGPTAAGIRWGGSESAMAPPPPVSTSRLPILMYHRIAPEAAPERKRYTVHPENFEAQLAYLRDAGFQSAAPDEWSEAVAARRPLPGRRVMLTFDDAYEDFGSTAWPLLQRYGFPAILFVVTGHVGKTNAWDPDGRDERLLDWPALEDLVGEGVRIGSHTVSHPRLTSCAAAEMVEELARSRAELAERLGVAADCVSYPWGGEDAVVHHFAAACGYATGYTCRTGAASATDAMLALPRLEVSADHSFGAFVRLFHS